MQKKIVVYSLEYCGYCTRAKALLKELGLEYKEIMAEDLSEDEIAQLMKKSQMRTFPQIFIEDKIIGGYTELRKLEDTVGIINYLKQN